MTDNLHIPRRLEGEHALRAKAMETGAVARPQVVDAGNAGINTIDQVSLESVINVLLQRGLCTEAELLAEEHRRRAVHDTMKHIHFTPVQIHREDYEYKLHDTNRLRRWAAKRHWSRRLGTLLFGWKWHRKKRDQNI